MIKKIAIPTAIFYLHYTLVIKYNLFIMRVCFACLELGIYTGCFGGMSVVYNVYIADLRFLLN